MTAARCCAVLKPARMCRMLMCRKGIESPNGLPALERHYTPFNCSKQALSIAEVGKAKGEHCRISQGHPLLDD